MPSDRPPISGRVDEDIFDRWHDFLSFHGLNAGPLLQAIVYQIPEPGERMPAWLARAVTEARKIQGSRGDRRPYY